MTNLIEGSPISNYPTAYSGGPFQKSSSFLVHDKQYRNDFHLEARNRIQSVISDLVNAKENQQISEEVMNEVVAHLVAVMIENEVASYVENWLDPALLYSNPYNGGQIYE